jgi:hypothetical protein
MQECCKSVAGVLQGCYRSVTGYLQECYRGATTRYLVSSRGCQVDQKVVQVLEPYT